MNTPAQDQDLTRIWNPEGLKGKKYLIAGIANEWSLAWAIARHLHALGAELAFTYAGPALEKRVQPLAAKLGVIHLWECDVTQDTSLEKLALQVQAVWPEFHGLVHSIAFADKKDLEGRFLDTSREGFRMALDVSAFSLVGMTRALESLLAPRASILTLTYYGSEVVVPNYNVMGVAKAALEACVRYLSIDLGARKIRINSLSAGPVRTLAASGIRGFREMLQAAGNHTPLHENISSEDVGAMGAFLLGPGSQHLTGTTIYVDSGAHILSHIPRNSSGTPAS
jgi:enoyl-[acyl-carrier protein] reductase I